MPDANVIERFAAWLRVKGLSQSAAAKKVGVSSATLSQVISGKYAGDVARVVEKMGRCLEQAARRERAPKRPDIVKTSVCQDVIATLRSAHDEGAMAVVCGPAGCGKTSASQLYCVAEPETIFVTVRPSGRRGSQGAGKPLLYRLAKGCGLELPRNTPITDAVEQIGAALKDSGRLVIVDEIDHGAEDIWQCLRMIHDIAECGMVLLATPAFLDKLRRANSSTLNQFLSRIAYKCDVRGLTEEDAEMILEGRGLDRTAIAAALAGAHGTARRLVHGIVGAQRLARDDGGKLDSKTIARAYSMLMEI